MIKIIPYLYKLGTIGLGLYSILNLGKVSEHVDIFINNKNTINIYNYLLIGIFGIIIISWISYNLIQALKNMILKISLNSALISIISFIFFNFNYILNIIQTANPNFNGILLKTYLFGQEILLKQQMNLYEKTKHFKDLIQMADISKYEKEIYENINWNLVNSKAEIMNAITLNLYKIQTKLILEIETKQKNGIFTKMSDFIINHPYLVGGGSLIIIGLTFYFKSEIYSYLAENGSILREFIKEQRLINKANLDFIQAQEILANQIKDINNILANPISDPEIFKYIKRSEETFAFMLNQMKEIANLSGEHQGKIRALDQAVLRLSKFADKVMANSPNPTDFIDIT